MGCHFVLQEIFPTQESNSCHLHWQVDSTTEPPGKPPLFFLNVNSNEISLLSITLAKLFINSVTIGTCPEAGRHAEKMGTFLEDTLIRALKV